MTLALSLAWGSLGYAQSQRNTQLPAPVPSSGVINPAPSAKESDDATLEVSPRIIPVEPPPATENPEDNSRDDTASLPDIPAHRLPYLGITVRPAMVRYHRQDIHGLEIVGVDAGSPAEHAGLKTPTDMTTIGATGETAGFMLGPLGNLMSPLLAHTGQLGEGGDMLVAVDEQRVSSPDELYRALERLQPGDTVWFTVMRIMRSGAPKTERIPVVLAAARS